MNNTVILSCGCVASSFIIKKDGEMAPTCVHGVTEQKDSLNLDGRYALCSDCGKKEPSSVNLPFFVYRGSGSLSSEKTCVCGYGLPAHNKKDFPIKCSDFTARGPQTYDRYYCGCYGWD